MCLRKNYILKIIKCICAGIKCWYVQHNGIIKTLKTDVIYNKHKPKQCKDPFQRLTVNKIIIMILLILSFIFFSLYFVSLVSVSWKWNQRTRHMWAKNRWKKEKGNCQLTEETTYNAHIHTLHMFSTINRSKNVFFLLFFAFVQDHDFISFGGCFEFNTTVSINLCLSIHSRWLLLWFHVWF